MLLNQSSPCIISVHCIVINVYLFCVQGRVPIVQVTDGNSSNGNEGGPRGHESGPTGHESGPGSGPPHHPTLRPNHLFPKEGETDCSIEGKHYY